MGVRQSRKKNLSGAFTPLLHTPPWRAQGQLYLKCLCCFCSLLPSVTREFLPNNILQLKRSHKISAKDGVYCSSLSHQPATSWVHYTTSCNTQSSAPEDGQNNCPKHVVLIGIINKPLLLHLVGCLY